MRNENARRRRKAMAVSVAVLAVRSAGPAFAQVTEIYEQNDNGQFAYNTYDSSGNATPHYYPTDNNWNQAAVDAVSGGLGFDGMQTGVVQTQLSNWNTSYYPGQTVPAYSYTLNNVTYYGPVDPTPTTDNIIIPGGNSVNDNAGNLTMASLNLGTGAAVAVNGGQSFTITGNLINDGMLVINNTNVNSPTIITIGGTLSGTGDIVLQHGGSYAQLNGTLTQPSGHSITGFGTINAALTNQGTVNANVSGQTLIMPTNASNSGLFEATGGGILLISGITVTQSGAGVTSANASNVTFTNATLTGGAVSSSNSGTIYISGTNTFNAITSTAAINIPSGNTLNITGNLVDNGTILINSDNGNANAILNISGGTVSGPELSSSIITAMVSSMDR